MRNLKKMGLNLQKMEEAEVSLEQILLVSNPQLKGKELYLLKTNNSKLQQLLLLKITS